MHMMCKSKQITICSFPYYQSLNAHVHYLYTYVHIYRTIGMFEQNNIGVRSQNPLAATASSLIPNTDLVGSILTAAETISEYLDGK